MSGEGEPRPGANPELKALLRELRSEGDAGDPLFPRPAPEAAKGAAPAAVTAAAAASVTAPAAASVAAPAPAPVTAAAAAPVKAAAVVPAKPRGKRSLRPLWLALGVLCIVAPLVALGLAALLRRPVVQVQVGPSPAPQPATATTAPAPREVVVVIREDAGVTASEDGGVADGGAEAGAPLPHRGEAPARAGDLKAAEGDAGTAAAPPRPDQGTDIW